MLSLEQIQLLEKRAHQAVELIKSLRSENDLLESKLEGYENRIKEMEVLIDSFKQDQSSIEEGIINALEQLDVLEDIVSRNESGESSSVDDVSKDETSKTETSEKEAVDSEEDSKANSEVRSGENELDIF